MAIDTHDEGAARALIAAAQADTSPPARRLRTTSEFFAHVFIVTFMLAPLFLGISVWRFVQALQGGSWIPFWFSAVGGALFLLPPIVFAFYATFADRYSGVAYRCLYNAAMSDDESLAPVIPISHGPTVASTNVKNVYVMGEESLGKKVFRQIYLLALVAWLLSLAQWSSSLKSPEVFVANFGTFIALMVFGMALSFNMMFFVAGQYVGRTVIADENGLRWRIGFLNLRWRQVSWDNVRTAGRFARLDVKRNKWEHDAHAYILDVGKALLTWGANPFLSAAGGAYTPKEIQAEWERFVAIVTARSGLLLRDITPTALAIARATGGRAHERKVAEMLLAQPHTSEPVTIPGLERAVVILADEDNPQRRRLLQALLWIPFLLFVALYVFGAIIQLRG